MDLGDITLFAILALLFLILLILVALMTFVLVIYERIKSFLLGLIQRQVISECTGNIDALPVFGPYDPAVYNKANALAVMRTGAALTYTNGCGYPLVVPGPDFRVVARYDGYDPMSQMMKPFAALFYSPSLRTMFVCFSATVTVTEWEDDFLVTQVPPTDLNNYQDGMGMHRGFYSIYAGAAPGQTSLRTNLLAGLKQSLKTGDTVLIGGHSLGAALATICYFDLCHAFPTTLLYTTGSPRVGNTAVAKFLEQPLNYRLFNTEDLIVNLPPPFLLGQTYSQSGSTLEFSTTLNTYSENHNDAYIAYLSTPTS